MKYQNDIGLQVININYIFNNLAILCLCLFSMPPDILRSLEVFMQIKEITQPRINLALLSPSRLTSQQKEQIVKALNHSPTGGNSKPFSWGWNEDTLCISHSTELSAHYLNRNNHTSYLALGCLIASIEVTAADMNLSWKVQFNEVTLYTEVKFFSLNEGGKDKKEILFPMIAKRNTYRGEFKKTKTLNSAQFTVADVNAFQEELVTRQFVSSNQVGQQFKNYLLKAESYLWVQTKALKDFLKEIRFFSSKSSLEERGIPTSELGISIVDEVMLAALRVVPAVLSWMRRIPLLNMQMVMAAKKTIKNSHFCLFSTKDLSASSLVQVGRVAMLTWLDLELQGYKVQPLSVASIPLLDSVTGHLPEDTRAEFKKLYQTTGVKMMSEQFDINQDQKPVWLFRFGEPV